MSRASTALAWTNWRPFGSLAGYHRKHLRSDLYAALIVTAIAIPESLGLASLLGLPIQTGLYCSLFAPLIFAAFTTSRRLVVGADLATVTIVAAGAAAVATQGTTAYGMAVGVLTLLAGILLVVMAVVRFGFLADLISQPVLIGFLAGVGLQILAGKLPSMVGLATHKTFFENIAFMFGHAGQVNLVTALLSASIILFILVSGRLRPNWPILLLALAGAMLAASLLNLHVYGVAMATRTAPGLPGVSLPHLPWSATYRLLATAFSVAVVVLAQSSAVSRSFAVKHDEQLDDNRELLALGFANITSALTHGFAINGGPSRTSASDMAGGRSQMVNIIMAAFIALVLLFATGLLVLIPLAALGAIVFTIGLRLIRIDELRAIYRVRSTEFWVAMAALIGVAALGVEDGVILAVAISIGERLQRQYHLQDQVMLLDERFTPWAERILGEDVTPIPGLVIYRFSESLFFENSTYMVQSISSLIDSARNPVRWLILEVSAVADIDYTSAKSLARLCEQLNADDVKVMLARVSPELGKVLDHYGITNLIGAQNMYPRLREAVAACPQSAISCISLVKALDLPADSYIVIGGGVLEALGIRDTNDVDLVVNKEMYHRLKHHGWNEYVSEDGKRVLFRGKYAIMTHWLGMDLAELAKNPLIIEDVMFINLDKLVKCKTQLARKKDLHDIRLIAAYQRHVAAV